MTWWDDHFDEPRFRSWFSPAHAPSRSLVRSLVRLSESRSVLDVGGGLAIDYHGWESEPDPRPRYVLLDATKRFVDLASSHGIEAVHASVESIPLPDHSFDAVTSRHVLEHLSSHEPALREMIRVASRLVLVSFFLPPGHGIDLIDHKDGLYHNRYSRSGIERLIRPLSRTFHWHDWGSESVLEIRL